MIAVADGMDGGVGEEGGVKDGQQVSGQSGISGRWCRLLKRERGERREATLRESEGTDSFVWKLSSLFHP